MSMILHISIHELCEQEGITETDIVQVVEHSIANPHTGDDIAEWLFHCNEVRWIQKALRLKKDLDIDWVAIAIIIDLLKQNEALELEKFNLEQRLQRFIENE